MKKLTTEEFIEKARKVHGDTYDYSKVTYTDSKTKVCIICSIHGKFWQTPAKHLQGQGCKQCGCSNHNGLIHGFGLNDLKNTSSKSYFIWVRMVERCYSGRPQYEVYKDCSICNEWKNYSKFKEWFESENYIDGYELDKDILSEGGKIYSPDTCCFIPHEINSLILTSNKSRGEYPIGVSYDKGRNKYRASISINNTYKYIGRYNTPKEAFLAYKQYKEKYIRDISTNYYLEGKISEKVYNKLINWKINEY